MSYNTPLKNTSLYRPYTPNTHNPFIAPNRIHIMNKFQEDDILELLTRVISATEYEDYSPTIYDTSFHQYLNYTFTEHIPAASLTPNEHITIPIVNFPPKDCFRVSLSQLTEHRHLRKRDVTHLFQ